MDAMETTYRSARTAMATIRDGPVWCARSPVGVSNFNREPIAM